MRKGGRFALGSASGATKERGLRIHALGASCIEQVLDLTREIFPGEVGGYEVEDPEIPGNRYHVYEVKAEGSMDEAMARDELWHRRLCQLASRIPGRHRLSIVTE